MSRGSCRFLYLVGQLGGGGMERQLHYLLGALDRHRYPVTVAVWNHRPTDTYLEKLEALGVPIIAFPEHLGTLAKALALLRLARQLRPELVQSWSFYLNPVAHIASKAAKAVAVGSIRGDFTEKSRVGPYLGRASARWPRHQICNSFAAKQAIARSTSPFSPRRVAIVPNAVRLPPARELGQGSDRPSLLGLGSLLPGKRWDRAIEAVANLRRRGLDCSLCIAGEGPLRDTLDAQIRRLGLEACIRLPGFVPDITKLFREITALVHPSETEGCPNAVMEAMAHGRPVVAVDSGDVARLVEDGVTGFVVPQATDHLLVDRLAQLLSDRSLSQSLGRAARAKAEREFGLSHLVGNTLAAYREMGWRDA